MAFSSVRDRTVVTGFDAGKRAEILAALETAYEGSPTARAMFDDWLVDAAHAIEIRYLAAAFQSYDNTGRLEIDLRWLSGNRYLDPFGKAVSDTLVAALAHELGHALTGRTDNVGPTYYLGDNVAFVNGIYQELGLPRQVSYFGYDESGGMLKLGYEYTGGQPIDAAMVLDADQDTGALDLSRDLLVGGPRSNLLVAGAGDDFLFGAAGNDTLDGGAGEDAAVYFGDPLDYDVRAGAAGTWTIRHARGAADAGADTLRETEIARFGSEALRLQAGGLSHQGDFALVIDSSASMAGEIDSLRAVGAALVDAIFDGGRRDARIGIVGFGDTTLGEASRVLLPFTDQDAFAARRAATLAALDAITAAGGGDDPETAFDGLVTALDGTMGAWRPGAAVHRILLLTDAAAKDSGLLAQVEALAVGLGATISTTGGSAGGSITRVELASRGGPGTRIEVHTILTSDQSVSTRPFVEIAARTGGRFEAASTGDLADKLLEIVRLPARAEPAPPDFDGDGTSDILWQHAGGRVVCWRIGESKAIAAGTVGRLGPAWTMRDVGDMDGDGRDDILWQHRDGRIAIWLTEGSKVLEAGSAGRVGPAWSLATAGDFDGDGRADLLWRHEDGRALLWEMKGLRVTAAQTLPHLGRAWEIEGDLDLNGDRRTDLALRNENGKLAVWELDGGDVLRTRSFGTVDPTWRLAATGDFNGDGWDDFLWRDDAGRIRIWEMDGTGAAHKGQLPAAGRLWDLAKAGDFDADGRDDLLWRHDGDGRIAIWEMDGLHVVASHPLAQMGDNWHILA